jgi:hypothetical protein
MAAFYLFVLDMPVRQRWIENLAYLLKIPRMSWSYSRKVGQAVT